MSNEEKRHVQRKPQREVMDKSEIYSILDEGMIAHVGFNDPDLKEPVVVPMLYSRDGDRILIHASTGGRFGLSLKAGIPVCATVTLVDGLVVARSAFNSSMNYRSVMAFGIPRVIEGDEKYDALVKVSDGLVPELWDKGREITQKEIAQTMVLELKLDQVSAKKRDAGALDDEDAELPIWAGIIPIKTVKGAPITNENASHVSIPDYVTKLVSK
jgi:nitroimidazol reductase NimA-like FMN-containing flavoprotein (pyridoxamine 5'-phosphate oxidase superfamily)